MPTIYLVLLIFIYSNDNYKNVYMYNKIIYNILNKNMNNKYKMNNKYQLIKYIKVYIYNKIITLK